MFVHPEAAKEPSVCIRIGAAQNAVMCCSVSRDCVAIGLTGTYWGYLNFLFFIFKN